MAIAICIFSSLLGFVAVTVESIIFDMTFWQGCATYFGVSFTACILTGAIIALRGNLPEGNGSPWELQAD